MHKCSQVYVCFQEVQQFPEGFSKELEPLSDCRLKTVNRALKGAANACVCNDSVMVSSIGDRIKAMVQGAGTHLGHKEPSELC